MQTEMLPTEDEVYRIAKLTQQFLKNTGYEQYEISNFAQPGFECDHNVGYWTRENYLGLGLGAASLLENVRYTNMTDIDDYIQRSKQIDFVSFKQENGEFANGTNLHISADVVSRKAQMEEFMFLGLRMKKGVTRAKFQETFGIPIEGVYKDALDHLKEQELLEIKAGNILLTEKGQDLSNYALAQFLL